MNTTLNAKITASDAASLLGVSLQYIHKQLKTKNLKSFKNQNSLSKIFITQFAT